MKHLVFLLFFLSYLSSYSQWELIDVPTTSGLNNAFFVDENIGYIVGGGEFTTSPNNTDGVILKTIDGGNTWSLVFSENSMSITNVFVVDNNIYAYGKVYLSTETPFLYKLIFSDDNGLTWDISTVEFNTDDMSFANGIIYFANSVGISRELKRIENGVISTIADSMAVYGVSENGILYISSNLNSIYKSVDSGNSWNELLGYPNGLSFSQIGFLEMKLYDSIIVIHYTYPNVIAFSTDEGMSWTQTGDEILNDKTLIVDSTTIYSIFQNNIGVTTNLENWSIQLEYQNLKRNLYFFNNTLGFVLGNDGLLFRTTNGGGLVNVSEKDSITNFIKVYPNPVKSKIHLTIDPLIKVNKICIYGVNGKLIQSYKSNNRILNVRKIKSGEYILKIETDKGVKTEKIQIIN